MKISKIVDALQYIDEDLVAEAITYRPDEKTMDEIIKISEGNGEEKAMKKKGKIAKRTLLVELQNRLLHCNQDTEDS